MQSLDPKSHEPLFCPETLRLGQIHWHLLSANQRLAEKRYVKGEPGKLHRMEWTEFGKEIGGDEIHWWVFKKEKDLETLKKKTEEALAAADILKQRSAKLKDKDPEETYEALVLQCREFAEESALETQQLLEYIEWLYQRAPDLPGLLFTYRVWGSTRRSDRHFEITAKSLDLEDPAVVRMLTEIVLGLRARGFQQYTYDRKYFDIGMEIYERDPERENPPEPSVKSVVRRTAYEATDECAVYFEEVRQSLRHILLDIEKYYEQRDLLRSDPFWRAFIEKVVATKKTETQLWDFKETLRLWHSKPEDREAARTVLAEDVASFANGKGGVLLIGVTDNRSIVGVGDSHTFETRLKTTRETLTKRLDCDQDLILFHQVVMKNAAGADVLCFLIVVGQAMEPVGARDEQSKFSFPVRVETGIERLSSPDVELRKVDVKQDNFDFLSELEQFVRDN